MYRIPVTPEPQEPQTVWVLVFKYDDDPLPGLIVGTSPERVVNAWLHDEIGGHNLDEQGFPVYDEGRYDIQQTFLWGEDLLRQQVGYARHNRIPRVYFAGQDISLHERTVDV